MTFNPGFVSLSWNYAGSPTGGTLSPEEENYHIQVLTTLQNNYQSWLSYYNRLLQEAIRDQDARRVIEVQSDKDALTQDYNNDVAAENQRYEAAKAAAASRDNTKFIFWLDRDSKKNPLYLDQGIGPSSGTAEFQALGGNDYYFIVEAAGPWTVAVYFTP